MIGEEKINRIASMVSAAVFLATLWAWHWLFDDVSAHGRYYLSVILAISGILAVVAGFRLFRPQANRLSSLKMQAAKVSGQRRQHYRILFDHPPHPVFVQKTDDHHPDPAFTCPVHDISETGIGLGCTGVFAHGQTVQGEIIFDSGRTAPVNGVVVREEIDHTCLRLHCTIEPPLLMAAQREQIFSAKAIGPRPAVSQTLLERRTESLPSHSPKGICRLKRP